MVVGGTRECDCHDRGFSSGIDGGSGRGLYRALGLLALGLQAARYDQYSLASMTVSTRRVTLGSVGSGENPVIARS